MILKRYKLSFSNPKSRSPRQVIDLKQEKVHVAECVDCKTGSYCFNISTPERVHTQCAPNSKEQEEWIQALLDVGAVFVEVTYDMIPTGRIPTSRLRKTRSLTLQLMISISILFPSKDSKTKSASL